MPRKRREKGVTGIYHVVMRGNNKQIIFETTRDYKFFVEVLEEYKYDFNTKILAYCLMDNHIHLLIHEGDESLSSFIRKIATKFAKWYNYKYKRTGYLFQDRFRSEPVDDLEYLLTVFRYIHQNPLKARIVNSISEYRWSSYSAYERMDNSFVDIYEILDLFISQKECISFLNEIKVDHCLEYYSKTRIPDEELLAIILDVTGAKSHSDIARFSLKERNQLILFLLNEFEVPVKQLSRVTGVTRDVILRIKMKQKKHEGQESLK